MSRRTEPLSRYLDLWWAYRLRWKRREYLWRAIRARKRLRPLYNHTDKIKPDDILCFGVMRNESLRLPEFLRHYRSLGVDHFLLIVHDSSDETIQLLADQPDISVWISKGSYRGSRFGLDWIGWLLARYGHDHWCVTVDADELLIYPHWTDHDLHQLTTALTDAGQQALGALMLDLYPKGPVNRPVNETVTDAMAGLEWFDPGPYRVSVQQPRWNRWVQGGPRDRLFFANHPDRAPTLNKLPLIRWDRRYAYANSTHSALPRHLNEAYDGPGDPRLSGVLLHTKFMPDIVDRSQNEKKRGQHFNMAKLFDGYYDALMEAPDLWYHGSVKLTGWQQLVQLGLMSAGNWQPGLPEEDEKI